MRRVERMYVWSGLVAFAVILAGMLPARLLPPPPPGDSAEQTAKVFAAHVNGIRLGLVLVMLGGTLLAPFCAQVVAQMRRMRGPGKAAADTQLVFGTFLVTSIVLPAMVMEAAVFRPDRDPRTIQLVSDIFFLCFVGLVAPFLVEALLLAIAVFQDRRGLFPRWIGYGLLATPLMSAFGGLCVFTHTGPLAWNGFLAFWVAVISFGWWALLMTVGMLHAIDQEDEEELLARAVADEPALTA